MHTKRTLFKSHRLLGFVASVTTGMPASAFRCFYTALVLPTLKYCAAVWLPQSKALQTNLASVQRCAAYTFYRRTMPKGEQLSYAGISSTNLLRHASWQLLDSRVRAATVRLMSRVMSPGHQELPYGLHLSQRTGRLHPSLRARNATANLGCPVQQLYGAGSHLTTLEHSHSMTTTSRL